MKMLNMDALDGWNCETWGGHSPPCSSRPPRNRGQSDVFITGPDIDGDVEIEIDDGHTRALAFVPVMVLVNHLRHRGFTVTPPEWASPE